MCPTTTELLTAACKSIITGENNKKPESFLLHAHLSAHIQRGRIGAYMLHNAGIKLASPRGIGGDVTRVR